MTVPQPAKTMFLKLLESVPEVLECPLSEASAPASLRVIAVNMSDLERLLERINTQPVSYTHLTLPTNREV